MGVDIVTNWLQHRKWVKSVTSKEGDKSYQEVGVDLVVDKKDSTYDWVEVKSDTWKTPNFFFETVSNDKRGTPGCFMKTKAHYLYYVMLNLFEFYILPVQQVRGWFLANRSDFVEKKTSTTRRGQVVYNTIGALVPRKRVVEEVPCVKLILY